MIYTIQNEYLTAKINTLGAELISVTDPTGKEFIYQPTELWIGQAKNQFPNVAVAKDGYAIMKGKQYPINQHGFLKLMELCATPISESSISFCLKSNAETLKWYPYLFEVQIVFTLVGNQIKQTYHVLNQDADPIYFGVSCHTGFYTAKGSYIEFGENDNLQELERPDSYLLNGKTHPFVCNGGKVPVNGETFAEGAHILQGFTQKEVTLVNPALASKITLNFADFPYLTLWSTPDASEFVCLMPWHSLPDYQDTNHIFEEKKGNITLPVGEAFTATQVFTFSSL